MSYQAFRDDVLTYGAEFACAYAARLGMPGRTLAAWLARTNLKAAR